MNIDIICNDGSPLGISEASIFGKDGRMGVGGAELALLTMCKGWHDAGHRVRLYNDPKTPNGSVFEQLPRGAFIPSDARDILIVFRSPKNEIVNKSTGYKVWWSTDPYTIGNFKAFAPKVNKIVTISKFHANYFKTMYGIENTTIIDLPVRTWEYEQATEKVPNRCIFTSIPDRGVMQLHAIWPLIVQEVPDASLVITSDWRLWNDWLTEDIIQKFRLGFARHSNVTYLGAIKRDKLIEYQLSAQLHLYPSIYEELFCLSVAESEVAGAYTLTSDIGALPTTNMGTVITGSPHHPEWVKMFVETAVILLKDSNLLASKQKALQQKAKRRFSLDNILKQWDKEIFNDI